MTDFFFNKKLNKIIDALLDHHLNRVRKGYMKKVLIRYLKTDIRLPGASAFIQLDSKPKIINFQFPILRQVTTAYLIEFLNDNITDAIKHEFAHLRYKKEGPTHLKWMNQMKLFKKDVKRKQK